MSRKKKINIDDDLYEAAEAEVKSHKKKELKKDLVKKIIKWKCAKVMKKHTKTGANNKTKDDGWVRFIDIHWKINCINGVTLDEWDIAMTEAAEELEKDHVWEGKSKRKSVEEIEINNNRNRFDQMYRLLEEDQEKLINDVRIEYLSARLFLTRDFPTYSPVLDEIEKLQVFQIAMMKQEERNMYLGRLEPTKDSE